MVIRSYTCTCTLSFKLCDIFLPTMRDQNRTKNNAKPHHRKPLRPPLYWSLLKVYLLSLSCRPLETWYFVLFHNRPKSPDFTNESVCKSPFCTCIKYSLIIWNINCTVVDIYTIWPCVDSSLQSGWFWWDYPLQCWTAFFLKIHCD